MRIIDGVEVLETLDEIAAPTQCLLVVYDAMRTALDATPIWPPGYYGHRRREEILPRWGTLVDAARAAGVTVAYTIHASSVGVHAPITGPEMRRLYPSGRVPDRRIDDDLAPDVAAIASELQPGPSDFVVRKAHSSIFADTPIPTLLRARRLRTIVFTGMATDSGISTSARQSIIEGYYPVIVADCCVSSYGRERWHDVELEILQDRTAALVVSADELLERWRA
jgi:nicotinamidase-related amidase